MSPPYSEWGSGRSLDKKNLITSLPSITLHYFRASLLCPQPSTSTHTHTHTHKHTNTNEIPPPSSSKDAKSLTWSLCQVCLDRMGHHFVRSLGPYSMNCGKDSGIDSESWHFLLYTNFTHFKMETCLYLFKVICVVVPLIYVCVKNKRPPRYLAHGAQ